MAPTYRVQATAILGTPGTVYVVTDYSHPETPFSDFGLGPNCEITSTPAEIPDGRTIVCHPDDEQRVRDALAVAQETPQWWLDQQQFERMLRAVFRGSS